MRIKSSVACLTLFTAAAVATPVAMAQSSERDNSGFFISGSYGGYKAHGGEFDDDRDLYGVSAGYQFNPFFALEADYIDFGKFGDDEVRSDLKGLALSAKGRLPLTDAFGIYGKVGAFASDMDVSAFDEDETYDEVSPFVGAGVDFMMTHSLTAFAEYNRYNVDIDEDDFNGQVTNDGPEFDTARVGLRYTF
ncbi:outer membrane beta-barrel protein [Marinobacter bryozoorum]|jgi:opacity protein-like surface antigen|uniref:outer membrane beta-barrel protein n=1 Tax=Marinobacter bryozoorum TaxID=256324 RepID=UPI002002E975|nr:outer membrane beta-barrel protein [Marinobacter bryozoorum]MCK7543948.1 outer membrane beta-barrel protein [Marinobacter bryozoorum]